MNKADKILDKKIWVKEELDRRLPPEQADRIWQAAREKLEEYLSRYGKRRELSGKNSKILLKNF